MPAFIVLLSICLNLKPSEKWLRIFAVHPNAGISGCPLVVLIVQPVGGFLVIRPKSRPFPVVLLLCHGLVLIFRLIPLILGKRHVLSLRIIFLQMAGHFRHPHLFVFIPCHAMNPLSTYESRKISWRSRLRFIRFYPSIKRGSVHGAYKTIRAINTEGMVKKVVQLHTLPLRSIPPPAFSACQGVPGQMPR